MKKFAAKLGVLLLIVIPLHAVINLWIFPPQQKFVAGNDEYLERLDRFLAEKRDVLFFAASVNWYHSPEDADQRKISEMLDERLSEHLVGEVDHEAYHMGVYRAFCQYVASQGMVSPKLIVISANLRSFSTHWHKRPDWRFDDLQRYLMGTGKSARKNILNEAAYAITYRPFKIFKVYESDAVPFADLPVYDGDENVGPTSRFETARRFPSAESTKQMIVYYYMQRIHEDHERLRQMVSIAELANRSGLRVLFYITPVDYQACDRRLGTRFSEQIRENARTICNALQREGHEVLNLSCSLPEDSFHYGDKFPNEHLNEKGLAFVAEKLAERVLVELADDGIPTNRGVPSP